mmetsp:Transcript_6519/g.13189  ORF Transcript_6519/g.13189 Transcript_6519/m.13189 type:complete len:595 (-) Transcript_6519:321-2105(-)
MLSHHDDKNIEDSSPAQDENDISMAMTEGDNIKHPQEGGAVYNANKPLPETPQDLLNRPSRKLNAFTVLILFTAVLGGMLYGLDTGTAATLSNSYMREAMEIPVLQSGEKDSEETTNQISMFTYIFHLGTFIGAPFAGFISDRVGRKPVILIAVTIFVGGSIWQTLAGLISRDFAWNSIIIGRAIGGIGLGFVLTMAPVYAAELAPSEWRGKSIICFQLAVTIGIFVMAIYNDRMEDVEWGWRLGIALQCIPGVLIFILTITVLPESPRWLIKVGRHEQAEQALRRLAVGTPDADNIVSFEIEQIRAEVAEEEAEGQGSFRELFVRENLPCLLCGGMIAFSQNISGINWLMSYATTLFNALNLEPFTYDLALKGVNVAFTLLAIPLIDIAGRKFLTVWGTTLVILAFLLIGIVICATDVQAATEATDSTVRSVQFFCVAMIFFFQAVFAVMLGPLTWVVPSEAFPLRLRGVGMAFCVSANLSTNIVLGDVGYQRIYSGTNLQTVAFILVALNLVIAIPSVVILQPETKGMSLEDLRRVFAYEKGGDEAKNHGTLRQFFGRNIRQAFQIYTCRSADTTLGLRGWSKEEKERALNA